MNKKGFTLIELVIVIVILGILAAVAVPKFAGLTGEAKSSVMKGIAGSIRAAAQITHAKWLAQCNVRDNCNDNISLEDGAVVCMDNTTTDKYYGYPLAGSDTATGSCDGGIWVAVNFDNKTIQVDNSAHCTIFYYKGTSDSNLKNYCTNQTNFKCDNATDCGVVYYYDGASSVPKVVACVGGCK